jgi:hypothetical protein
MQIAHFGAALPEVRVRPAPVLIGLGGLLLSPLSWLLTGAGPHLAAGPVYLAGAAFLAAGLLLLRRRASGQ